MVRQPDNCRNFALNFDFTDPPSQAHFVTLMWEIGSDFFLMPGFQHITAESSRSGPERIDAYYQVSPALIEQTALNANDQLWYEDGWHGEETAA